MPQCKFAPKRATASDVQSGADVKAAMDRWLPFSFQCPENWPSSWQESYWQKNNIFLTVTDRCFFKFIFKWSIVELQCYIYITAIQQSNSVSIHTYIRTYILFHIISHSGSSQDIEFPVLPSRASSFIHFVDTTLHPRIPNSQSKPPPPLWHPPVNSLCPSFCLFHRQVHLCHILDSTNKWNLMSRW